MTATHGWWCNTVTYPTTCSGCGESVFFFRCDHGSAVFFDALGEPWPDHDCGTSWTRDLTRWTDESGTISVQLRPGITVRRPPSGTIDPSVVTVSKRRALRQDPIKRVDPRGEVTVVGVLREKRLSVSVAYALKLPGGSERRLEEDLRARGDFAHIHPLPQSSAAVPDDYDARLVVLSAEHPYASEEGNPAQTAANAILESRGNAPRGCSATRWCFWPRTGRRYVLSRQPPVRPTTP